MNTSIPRAAFFAFSTLIVIRLKAVSFSKAKSSLNCQKCWCLLWNWLPNSLYRYICHKNHRTSQKLKTIAIFSYSPNDVRRFAKVDWHNLTPHETREVEALQASRCNSYCHLYSSRSRIDRPPNNGRWVVSNMMPSIHPLKLYCKENGVTLWYKAVICLILENIHQKYIQVSR